MPSQFSCRRLALLLLLSLVAATSACGRDTADYEIIQKEFLQPVDHADPDAPLLTQHVDILIPHGAAPDSPVFFNLGNESDLTEEALIECYELHGRRKDIIHVQAEHRGYGQSLTPEADQSKPSYVLIDQALADAHEVVRKLKEDYPGPWMGAGWSYGGGLIINYAARYPDDFKVILSSSGVVDWPFLNYEYEKQIRETLDEACYNRLVRHARNLEPKEPFDDVWLQREFLYGTIMGVTQYSELNRLKTYFRIFSFLPTRLFLKVLHLLDNAFGKGKAWEYALGQGKQALARDEADTGVFNWRVWRYQQCTEVGTFYASEGNSGLFLRTYEGRCEECQIMFGEKPPASDPPEWSPRAMLEELTVPLIFVGGGNDPWLRLGLQPDYKIPNGKYFYVPDGFHCPERDDPQLARKVLDEMLKYALADS